MASVFLSYVHEDGDRARPIARVLEEAGHKVWWDRHIKGGAEYSDEIEAELSKADFVVVLWSERSVHSAWVRDEAEAGRRTGRLVPLRLDEADPPLGFRQFQTIDLAGWKGHGETRLRPLLDALRPSAGDPISVVSGSGLSGQWRPSRRLILLVTAMAVILAAGFGAWRLIAPRSSAPVVAVAAADQSADSEALARDLLVKLGSLRSAQTDALRLTGTTDDKPRSADFIFEASGSNDPNDLHASLALLTGKNRSVLWSKDFEVQGGNRTALKQSVAYTAGQVLDCTLQTSEPGETRLDEQTLKLFLNGCALFGERYRSDPASVVPIFSQVVAAAPHFQPAWAKLLLAEAQNTRGQIIFYGRSAPGLLPAHIRAVRKLNPKLPELYVAEAALLPLSALDQRLRLVDEAVRLNPDSPDLLVVRAENLSWIGRNHDASEDARRAAELDPLSPGIRSNLIQALTFEGQLPAAEEELRRAEQLWPASPTINDARFRLHSRYGDARDALRMVQSPELRLPYPTQDMETYLLARLNPTRANVDKAIAATRGAQLAQFRKQVQLAQLLAEFGRNDELYKELAGLQPDQIRVLSAVFYRPQFQQFRRDPRFMPLAARAGLINVWRKSGKWPDFCSEPDLPYNCKAEAAKLAA